ncbi:coiled-coil domain-containing protein 137 [Monomorium pharaonis]|uniref:coiled-coil domain-containing protein 137 n=1 Tax=Monomorium pharaonis TaxID=307658 RepID=UPI00063EFCA9|nr:coiled-coil domain-containing protein 137 [Monomorium pharaonis]XP_012530304.1 coiled-coil domain-containing protein 137 [Monomorium pharaonis]XP_012530315.1 coiled-coil domain-containing protein 137 [Monomorium pharaonis]XP_012530324.1 coiled-coil domain-containing protein 137 [Monomorium pharaonis]
MGRKIPGKKHRGIKDPEQQRIKRLTKLELRTNTAPKNEDEQAIPKSLERVIKLKEAAKSNGGILKKKQRKKDGLICVGLQHRRPNCPKTKLEKIVPVFQQRPGESGKQFMHRVSKDTYDFLKEVAFEKKYGVRIERDSDTGKIQGLIKCKPEKDDVEALQIKHKNLNKKRKTAKDSITLREFSTKNDKRKLKLRVKKEKKLARSYDEFEKLQDKVVFGEVADEPPKLKIKSKEMNETRKPKNLLLNSLLEDSKVFFGTKVIKRSRKRKYLPEMERRRLEKQQSEAVAAYKQLKSQRSVNRSC